MSAWYITLSSRAPVADHERSKAGDTCDDDSAAKLRRGTLAEGTKVTTPGEGGKPVEMQSESKEAKREYPVEAGPGKVVLFHFRLESHAGIVTGQRSWEGRQGLGLNHGLQEPWAEGFALLG